MKTTLLFVLLLAGCSSIKGVEITEDERKLCETSGCTVWTANELEALAKTMWQRGYQAGVKSI